jgi:YVTN family beta-propeller protein
VALRFLLSLATLALGASVLADESLDAGDLHEDRGLRRPIALVRVDSLLVVANRDAGSISVIDLESRDVLVENRVGRRLSSLAAIPETHRYLATDEEAHELLLLRVERSGAEAITRLAVPHTPVHVTVLPDGVAAVASLWARQLTFVRVETSALARIETIDLPFAPRMLEPSPDGAALIVADSFGGRVGIVDVKSRKLVSLRSLEAHNIRGLALGADGKSLLVAHQQMSSAVPTERSRVFWGAVVSNLLRTVSLPHLLDYEEGSFASSPRPIVRWSLFALGQPGRAAGDPGCVEVTSDGTILVAAQGVDELLVMPPTSGDVRRVKVGDRPADIELSCDGKTAFVANTFSDTVSVVDIQTAEVSSTISLGTMRRLATHERGELVFRDARLSLDGWVSCHSCHTDGHTSGELNDNFGDRSFGTPKKILTLHGSGPTGPWGWRGGKITLDDQIARSIETTMRLEEGDKSHAVSALVAFVDRLDPVPSVRLARRRLDNARVEAGRRVFNKRGCKKCHSPPLYESAGSFRVGLRDEAGVDRFNPPSLLGVSQRAGVGYFHDGRSKSLRDIFEQQRHPRGQRIDDEDLDRLLYFLESL